eukprot:6549442-Prymnesium_polylepis.1
MSACLFGDSGAKSFSHALRRGGVPKSLEIASFVGNDIGDEGANSITCALLQSRLRCHICPANNRISLAAQSALLGALEELHDGPALGHAMNILPLNPPFWPAAMGRAMARGQRRAFESGRLLP